MNPESPETTTEPKSERRELLDDLAFGGALAVSMFVGIELVSQATWWQGLVGAIGGAAVAVVGLRKIRS